MNVTELQTTGDFREQVDGVTVGFPCAVHSVDFDQFRNGSVAWHWHDEMEIVIVTQGAIDAAVPHHTYHLAAGDGILIPSGQLHSYHPSGSGVHHDACLFDPILLAGYRNSYFDRTFLSPVLRVVGQRDFVFFHDRKEHQTILQLFHELVEIEASGTPGWEMEMAACLSRIWVQLFRLIRPNTPSSSGTVSRSDQRAKDMITYLQQHYDEGLTMEQIAAAANIGPREGFRVFRSTLGMSPVQYLTSYRLHKAAELLTQGTASVTEISERCGFSTPSYFARVFRAQMGCTPREYRTAFQERAGRDRPKQPLLNP